MVGTHNPELTRAKASLPFCSIRLDGSILTQSDLTRSNYIGKSTYNRGGFVRSDRQTGPPIYHICEPANLAVTGYVAAQTKIQKILTQRRKGKRVNGDR